MILPLLLGLLAFIGSCPASREKDIDWEKWISIKAMSEGFDGNSHEVEIHELQDSQIRAVDPDDFVKKILLRALGEQRMVMDQVHIVAFKTAEEPNKGTLYWVEFDAVVDGKQSRCNATFRKISSSLDKTGRKTTKALASCLPFPKQ